MELAFDDAMQLCNSLGAKMLLVESHSEQQFIQSLFSNGSRIYVRCTDKDSEGNWTCVDSQHYYNIDNGTVLSSSGFWDWGSSQPDGGTAHNCLCLNLRGRFSDNDCSKPKHVFCTQEIGPTTTDSYGDVTPTRLTSDPTTTDSDGDVTPTRLTSAPVVLMSSTDPGQISNAEGTVPDSSSSGMCPPNWVQNGTKCYYIHGSKLVFDDAMQKCNSLGAKILLIESFSEQQFIKSIVANKNLSHFLQRCTDKDSEGNWTCVDSQHYSNIDNGTVLSSSGYWDWGKDEPDGGTSKNCLAATSFGVRFVDTDCNNPRSVICTRDIGSSSSVMCQPNWLHNGTKCYYRHHMKLAFDDSMQLCKNLSADMLLVESHSEQQFIQRSFFLGVSRIYLRCTDKDSEGNWTCVDSQHGKVLSSEGFWDWGHDEPDGGTTDNCLTINHNGKFADVLCSSPRVVVCTQETGRTTTDNYGDVTPTSATSACINNNDECDYWAERGECTANPGYMLHNCQKSCGVCEDYDVCSTVTCLNGGVCITINEGDALCVCPIPNWGGEFCEKDLSQLTRPMGMHSEKIMDSQLSSSSHVDFHDATASRLNNGAGWIPNPSDTKPPWICVEFLRVTHVMGMVIKGKFTSFSFDYSRAEEVQQSTSVSGSNYWFTDPLADLPMEDRRLMGVVYEPCETTYFKLHFILPLVNDTINMTMEILGYYPPSPIEILCRTNCQDRVTTASSMSVRVALSKTSSIADFYISKSYRWDLKVESNTEPGQYDDVQGFEDITITGRNRDIVAIRGGTLMPGRRYQLHVYVGAVGENYEEHQYYEFNTTALPSLGRCSITPQSGYAAKDTFTLSCSSRSSNSKSISSDQSNPLTYQITSRYGSQGRIMEKQVAESDQIEGVDLDLPVGSLTDNFTLHVVIRAVDVYGGYDEAIVSVKVMAPTLNSNSSLMGLFSPDSDDISDKLHSMNVLFSLVNTISHQHGQHDSSNITGNASSDTSDQDLVVLTQIRTTLITAVNAYAHEVNTTKDARLLVSALQYATEVTEELTHETQLSLIPSLEVAVDILYNHDLAESQLPDREFSFGMISTLHTVELKFADEEVDKCTGKTTETPLQAMKTTTTSSNQGNEIFGDSFTRTSNFRDEPISGPDATERLEHLESKVVGNVLKTVYPGCEPMEYSTNLADMTFTTVSNSDIEQGNSGVNTSSSQDHCNDNTIPTKFLSCAGTEGSIGISTISRTRNPYPGSCGMTSVKSLDLRDETGKIISVTCPDAEIEVTFDSDAEITTMEEHLTLATDVDMVVVSFKLDKPGAAGVQVFIDGDQQDDLCIQVL
ncbi:uncharacterized protein [Amphiura filiformis]|uniref:uncharacterized protein n=1 Tax=Amphiura filiformis TaxID=82378 RepID=UPI003B217FC2